MTINLPSLDTPPAGAIRFNSDSMKLEVYRGGIGIGTTNQTGGWWTIDNASVGIGTSSISGSSGGSGTRGVFGGGETPDTNTIDYVNIQSTGNAIDFGDLISSTTTHMIGGCSSLTRGLFGGGRTPTPINNINFITISSTGNAQDFGDLTSATTYPAALSNSTRGIFASGSNNIIHYVTIASTGNAQDFGDVITSGGGKGCSSSTRGIYAQGASIEFITISTLGNSSSFGITSAIGQSALSNAIRGIFAGGNPTNINIIDFITISTTGNATDFGDLTVSGAEMPGTSSSTRGVFAGGNRPTPTRTNVIDYVTIMSTGNAIDFGDLTVARSGAGACSNGHGGL